MIRSVSVSGGLGRKELHEVATATARDSLHKTRRRKERHGKTTELLESKAKGQLLQVFEGGIPEIRA